MRSTLTFAAMVFMLLLHTNASAITIDFTEVYSSADGPTQTLVGDEWAPYITTSNVFWYSSSNDPFDGMGIANNPPTAFDPVSMGEIVFLGTINSDLNIDWVTLNSNDISINAFDSDGNLVDTFFYVGTDTTYGTATLTGPIASIQFHDDGGSVGISTLDFTYAPVPEPASLILLGSGLLGVLGLRKKKITT